MLDSMDDALQTLKCTVKGEDTQSDENRAYQCEATQLGVMLKGLQALGLWPRPRPGNIRMSIHGLLKKLRYRVENLRVHSMLPGGHTGCFTRNYLWSAATSVLSRCQILFQDLIKSLWTLPFWKSEVWTKYLLVMPKAKRHHIT